MADCVISILNLIIFPFKSYNLFIVMASFLILALLFNIVNRLIHS